MANNIGIRLSVDGEQKFKTAMKQAANSVKDVDTRLKLATAEFKKNGDAQKLMQTRAKTLNEEIKRQTEIVDALEDALETVEKQYGENSTQALSYEAQLNRARQKLVQMETALDNNAKGLDENGKAFEDAGKKAEKATVSFTDLHHAIENIQGAAKTAASAVINFGKAAWNSMAETAAWADNLKTLSVTTGLSVEELQRYAYAAEQVDTSAEDIYTTLAKMVNPTDQMAEALKALGVQTTYYERTGSVMKANAAGQMNEVGLYQQKSRAVLDIFWDTIDAISKLGAVEREAAAKDIFGKSFAQLLPLINAGRAGWEEAGNGLHNVVNEENIDLLGEFDDKLQALEKELEGLKGNIFSQLAPGFSDLAASFTQLVQAFNDWAASEQGQAALKGLSDAISNILGGIGEEDFEKLVTTATKIIEGLASAINSITNDPTAIINGVKGALIGYAGLTVSKEVLSLLTLLRSLGGSGIAGNIGSVFGKLGNLFTSNASAESAAAAAPAVSAAGGHKLLAGKALGTAAGIEAVALGVAAVESGVKMIEEITQQGTFLGIGQRDENGSIDIGGFKIGGDVTTTSLWNALGITGNKEEYRDPMTGLTQAELEAAAAQYMKQVTEETQQMAEEAAEETVTTYSTELNGAVQEQEMSWLDVFTNSGASAGGAFAAGLSSSIPAIAGVVSRINSVVAQISAGPATTTAYGLGLGKTGANITRNNSIYINNLNQSNAADVYDTLRNMNGAQEHLNRGWGYVPT